MALLKGTLDALVLKALSFGPMHGFQVTQWIEAGSQGEFEIEGAALLQALHRLEAQRLVAGSWAVTENNRRARYYTLTAAGRTRLKTETATLKTAAAALATLLDARTAAIARNR